MPRNDQVARRYAKALYQLAAAGDQMAKPQQVLEELRVFEESFIKNDEVRKFFCSPVVDRAEKKQVLADIETKLPGIARFLLVLADADRLEIIREIVREFKSLLEESAGEVTVELETARKFSDAAIEEIKQLLEAQWRKKVRLQSRINPEIMGGFVARASGKSMNASALAQLESLGEQLVAAR